MGLIYTATEAWNNNFEISFYEYGSGIANIVMMYGSARKIYGLQSINTYIFTIKYEMHTIVIGWQ
jgi:hypothetical protein